MPGDVTLPRDALAKAAAAALAAFLSLAGTLAWQWLETSQNERESASQRSLILQTAWTLKNATAYARELKRLNPELVIPNPLETALDDQ